MRAAALLSVSQGTIDRLREDGEIEAINVRGTDIRHLRGADRDYRRGRFERENLHHFTWRERERKRPIERYAVERYWPDNGLSSVRSSVPDSATSVREPLRRLPSPPNRSEKPRLELTDPPRQTPRSSAT
jgi:hypothetical protein